MNGMQQAVDEAIRDSLNPEQAEAYQKECASVTKLWKEYDTARKFDENARKQYAVDRRYAAGTADPRWAVDTNLVGSFIDILVSFLYARNPDVSIRKSPQVKSSGTAQYDDFAKTCELVVSSLWKKGRLKMQARKTVRSSLSTGPGWLKAIMIADSPEMAQMQMELNDSRDNLAALNAQLQKVNDPEFAASATPEQLQAEIDAAEKLQASLQQRMEVSIRKYMAFDFCASENVQVSLDVSSIEDYLDASWVANAIYRPKTMLKELFSDLSEAEINATTSYYQRDPQPNPTAVSDVVALDGYNSGINATDAEQYTTSSGPGQPGRTQDGIEFAKIVELWNRNDGHVYTMIDGLKRWAKKPFQPPYPSSRFYPYFNLSFFLVDGARHPQSLSWRLRKLQDEYARSRSNFRVTRERAIPGVIFNASGIEEQDVTKLSNSVHQELIGIKPVNPETPIQNLFAPKPYAPVDMRLFDNSPIIADMEKVSGVQEALQSSNSVQKTATQADIEQQGFTSRTSADRDTLETMLQDLAQYTVEVALGALNHKDAVRIAGAGAYWPHGMDIDDLLTMVEIDIQAGTTGKPKSAGDREAWGVVLPVIKETLMQIQASIAMGDTQSAKALMELVRETMKRMGDDTDIDRFFPALPQVDPITGRPVGGAPGVPAAVPPVGGSVDPTATAEGSGAPAPGQQVVPPALPPTV